MTAGLAASLAPVAANARPAAGGAAPLPLWVMAGWGLGTLGPVIVLSATNALLLRFMTDYVGLGAGVASLLIGVSKLYDAFADPTMGWISDHTRSRWGRRRPYLVAGGALLALSLFGLFWVPAMDSDAARTAYMAVTLIFYATAYTVFNIPYMAMPAEMSASYHQRTALMSWRVGAVGLAQIIAMFLGTALVDLLGGGARGHLGMAAVLAPIVMASAVACFFMTRDAPFTERSEQHSPLREQVRSVLGNRPYVVLIGVKLLTLSALSAQAVFPFFFQRILGVSNFVLATYFAVASVALIASQPLWIRVGRRVGKRIGFQIALGVSVPIWLSWLAAQAGDPLWTVMLRAAATGVVGGGALLMGQALLPDTMEYDHLRTGLRREGVFAGFYTTVEKVAAALGIAVVGAILSAAGYVQSRGAGVVQPESALTAIRMVIALLPAAVSLGAFLLLFAYSLSEERLGSLRAQGGDRAMTPQVRRGYVDGRFGQVHFHRCGPQAPAARPALVCLHATAYSGQTFLPLMRRLGTERPVLALDTPGYGGSDAPPGRIDFGLYAEALAEAVRATGTAAAGPVDLFGYHTGALLATEIARRHPALVRRIVLCGVPFFEGTDKAAWREKLVHRTELGESFDQFRARWDYFITRRTPGLSLERAYDCFVDELRSYPRDWWAHDALFELDAGPCLAAVGQPVLVVNLASALAPASRAAAARLPDARVAELPQVGGAPFDLGTGPLAEAIRGFLDAAPERSP